MARVLIVGAGGVGQVVTHKCAQVPDVFSGIVLASRTEEKCRRIAAQIERPIETAQVDANDVSRMSALIRRVKPDIVINVALPYQDLPIMDACLETGVDYVDTANYEPPDEAHFEDSWQWAYSVDTYTARLVATRISNEKFTAEMFISKTGAGAYEDFKWFEGTVRYDHTHANWKMYESPVNNVQWLDIEWTKDWEADTSQITYTNVKAGAKEFGSYITYGITDDADYNAFYTLSSLASEVNIKYNTLTKEGRVKAPVYFEDSEWHCWNEQFQDTECSQ